MLWFCQLMDAGYLYSPGRPWPSPRAIEAMIIIALLGAMLACWCGTRLRRQQRPISVAVAAIACWLLGLVFFFAGPGWSGPLSARIAYLTPSALGLLLPLLAMARPQTWPSRLRPLLCAMACDLRPQDTPWPWSLQIPWLALHALGLYGLIVYEGWGAAPLVTALCCLVAAGAAQWIARAEGRGNVLRAEILAPLLLPMAANVARWLGRGLCRTQVDDYVGYPYADLLSPWLNAQIMLYAGVCAMVLTTAVLCWRALRARLSGPRDSFPGSAWWGRARLSQAIGILLLALGSGWYVAMVARHLSHGATGSDPYCYLQMAVDLSVQGTALHRFPLAELAYRRDLPVWPLVPVGYHPPNPHGWAATVWPIGWPLLLVPWYRLGGEQGVLLAAPAMVVLAALIGWAYARCQWSRESMLVGGLAGWLLLTSREVVWRSLVPMADGASMALAMLAMVALVRAHQQDDLRWSAGAGLALGMAYLVRHPLLPLALAAVPLAMVRRWAPRRRMMHSLVFFCSAALIAIPDLWYHANVLGSPWIPESPESDLLSWRYMGSGLALFLDQGLFGRHEFGFVLPLVLYGLWLQVRQPTERLPAMIMILGFVGVLLFGLAYRALRLRDLLALFPWLALWAGRGLAGLWASANRPGGQALARRALLLILLWAALSARSTWTLQRLQDPRISTFGHLSAAQRRAYDQLATLLPRNAVVACGLGAGAIARYTGRETVRPASWSADDFQRFIALLAENDRPFYAVQDGTEMDEWLSRARAEGHSFASVATLNLPTFAAGGEPSHPGAPVHRLERPD